MKKITNWFHKKFQKIRWFFIKSITTISFRIIAKSIVWNEFNYDKNIIELYKSVRRKKAFIFKAKIMSPGKGITNQKFLFVETPGGMIEVKLMKKDNPDFFKTEKQIFELNDKN